MKPPDRGLGQEALGRDYTGPSAKAPVTGRRQHLGQLQLPRMKIEAADTVWQDVRRQHPDRQLMAFAQTLGQCDGNIAARQAHLVGQRLRGVVESGEVVAPAFDLAP